jgi:hypothetical protein
VFGEQAYAGRYRQAIKRTSLDYQTLRNYAWVARRFAMSRRRDTLSFGHHAEVAALPEPEQDFWLRKAEEHRWPVKHLRRQVRVSLAERSAEPYDRAGSPPSPDHSSGKEASTRPFNSAGIMPNRAAARSPPQQHEPGPPGASSG